jgi:hypothetical protein
MPRKKPLKRGFIFLFDIVLNKDNNIIMRIFLAIIKDNKDKRDKSMAIFVPDKICL